MRGDGGKIRSRRQVQPIQQRRDHRVEAAAGLKPQPQMLGKRAGKDAGRVEPLQPRQQRLDRLGAAGQPARDLGQGVGDPAALVQAMHQGAGDARLVRAQAHQPDLIQQRLPHRDDRRRLGRRRKGKEGVGRRLMAQAPAQPGAVHAQHLQRQPHLLAQRQAPDLALLLPLHGPPPPCLRPATGVAAPATPAPQKPRQFPFPNLAPPLLA